MYLKQLLISTDRGVKISLEIEQYDAGFRSYVAEIRISVTKKYKK